MFSTGNDNFKIDKDSGVISTTKSLVSCPLINSFSTLLKFYNQVKYRMWYDGFIDDKRKKLICQSLENFNRT